MELKEKPVWFNCMRAETLVWFKKYVDDVDHVEIRPRYVEFRAKTLDGRREETHAISLSREDEICPPGSENDPESCFSIWNYVEISQGIYCRVIRLTEKGQEMVDRAEAYMTELKAWETDKRDWENYQMLKRKFEGADRAA